MPLENPSPYLTSVYILRWKLTNPPTAVPNCWSGTNKIILDAYNANPNSMKAAIENFSRIAAENKVLILGAMMEMGTESESEHQNWWN